MCQVHANCLTPRQGTLIDRAPLMMAPCSRFRVNLPLLRRWNVLYRDCMRIIFTYSLQGTSLLRVLGLQCDRATPSGPQKPGDT